MFDLFKKRNTKDQGQEKVFVPEESASYSANDGDIVRRKIVFGGRVQGVGFRWRARTAAEELGLTGWVKNEWDQTVIMEVQGPSVKVDMLVQGLQQARYIQIENMRVTQLPVDTRESQFRVISNY